jgi:ferredoxin
MYGPCPVADREVSVIRYVDDVVTLRLRQELCSGCGMCVDVCPRAVFGLGEDVASIADLNACIECGACSKNCPTGAISVEAGAGCCTRILFSKLKRR